jgi:4-amino-4-deoxy-L-arabinose transferase-like glycosyltransferase
MKKDHPFLPVLLIFIVAFVARLIGLTYHSLWFDEVMSAFWASKPAPEIWRVGLSLSQDKHPPLYYLLLHYWTGLFGPTDAAMRWLGVLIGAAAVFPAYGIGAILGGRRAGAIGALLVALNPFLIWYSQEARMFMPATTFALVGLWGVLRNSTCVTHNPEPVGRFAAIIDPLVAFLLIVAGFATALYSYLFSAFLLPVAGLWLLLAWWQGRGTVGNNRRFATGVSALVVVGVLFLPLARAAWLVSGAESAAGQALAGIAPAVQRLLTVYSVGWPTWAGEMQPWIVAGAGVLALAGLLAPARWLGSNAANHPMVDSTQPLKPDDSPAAAANAGSPQKPGLLSLASSQARPTANRSPLTAHRSPVSGGGWHLAIWLLIPLALGGLLLARDRTIFAETRYFIFLVPALCLAWGRALAAAWTWRWPAGLAGLAVVIAVTALALPANWAPENRREAWREAAAYVAAHAGPNDAVLVHADYVHVAFDRYFDGPQPVFFPFTEAITDPDQVDATLQGLVNAGFHAVWLVQSHHQELDSANLIASWLAARYPLITEQYPAGIALRGYATRYRQPDVPAHAPRMDPAAFGPLLLLSCAHAPGPLSARDDLFHPPSGWVRVTTYWTAAEPMAEDIFPAVQMVDDQGQVWGDKLERSTDAIHLWPTSRWTPREAVRVDYDVNLNPITPPGAYRIVVYTPDAQVVCGEVVIE